MTLKKLFESISKDIYAKNLAKISAEEEKLKNFNDKRRADRTAVGLKQRETQKKKETSVNEICKAIDEIIEALRNTKNVDSAKAITVPEREVPALLEAGRVKLDKALKTYSNDLILNDKIYKDLQELASKPIPRNYNTIKLINYVKTIRKDNGYKEEVNIGKDLSTNPTDTAQHAMINGIYKDPNNPKSDAEELSLYKKLTKDAYRSERDRKNILAGKEVEQRNTNAKNDISASDLKLKYGTGMNSGTAQKIAKIKRWEDLNTGFKTNYALIQNWKAQGIKPDANHIFYRVGKIDGNPVCYVNGQFFVANRNWWAGTKAKLTSIKYSEPEYCSENPPDNIRKKWEEIKPRASIHEDYFGL